MSGALGLATQRLASGFDAAASGAVLRPASPTQRATRLRRLRLNAFTTVPHLPAPPALPRSYVRGTVYLLPSDPSSPPFATFHLPTPRSYVRGTAYLRRELEMPAAALHHAGAGWWGGAAAVDLALLWLHTAHAAHTRWPTHALLSAILAPTACCLPPPLAGPQASRR